MIAITCMTCFISVRSVRAQRLEDFRDEEREPRQSGAEVDPVASVQHLRRLAGAEQRDRLAVRINEQCKRHAVAAVPLAVSQESVAALLRRANLHYHQRSLPQRAVAELAVGEARDTLPAHDRDIRDSRPSRERRTKLGEGARELAGER